MSDLGDLLGSMMTGLIRARRVADEQTAALAEYYRTNPLLEGLSVPRIRIPELTIDLPFLIEGYQEGVNGQINDPDKIASSAAAQVKESLVKHNVKPTANFHRMLTAEVKKQLLSINRTETPAVKEAVSRAVQQALSNSLTRSKAQLTDSQREGVFKDIRSSISDVALAKDSVPSSLIANIETADVKEKSTPGTVVRLKITLKEEGLEWTTQATDNGGVKNTLQPE